MSAAERHPEWRQVDKDGKLVGRGPFEAAWPWLCVNNGYADEIAGQVEELMSLYECDGFWFDILMMHGDGCLCTNCFKELHDAAKDPQNTAHRFEHNNEVIRRFMARMTKLIRGKLPRGRMPQAGIFYNGRMGLTIADELQHFTQIEIESLPTGGWGYGFYPLWSRFARPFGLPMVGMTGRFHRSWADWGGLKHPDALKFEAGGILATGGVVNVGDQMHPRGRLNKAVYRVIGEAFREVEAIEQFCIGAEGVADVALLTLDSGADNMETISGGGALEGAAKMLLELHHQFDVITPHCKDLSKYDLLVIADRGEPTNEVTARLRDFVAQGGKLLLSHQALLSCTAGNFVLADEMGVDYVGPCASDPDYFEITELGLHTPVTQPDFCYSLYEGPSSRVEPRPDTQTLAVAHETYFNRTWGHFTSHGFTPPLNEKANYPAVTRNGNVIYLHGPIFTAYQKYGNLTFRALVGKCLDLLLPARLVETDAPSTAEVALMRQGDRWLVHVVNYHPCRRANTHVEVLESPVPLREVTVRVRYPRKVNRVSLARSGEVLPLVRNDSDVAIVVPRVDTHEIVVFE